MERTSERSSEVERLRHENAELKRELQSLKQMYDPSLGSSSCSMAHMPNPSLLRGHHERSYSVSPSISSTMDSVSVAGSPQLDMTSSGMTSTMLSPTDVFADPLPMSILQQYSMVPPSSIRQHSSQSSPESSDYGSDKPATASALQSLNVISSSSRMPPPFPRLPEQQSKPQLSRQG